VQEGKCHRGERHFLFSFFGYFLDELGAIPFGEEGVEATRFEVPFGELKLGGFSGTVDAFDDDELAGEIVGLSEGIHFDYVIT
jgi:hypothetical protein